MNIRFISSLTPDDESRIAPALLTAARSLLDQFPISYTIRIETSEGRVFQHGRLERARPEPERAAAAGRSHS